MANIGLTYPTLFKIEIIRALIFYEVATDPVLGIQQK